MQDFAKSQRRLDLFMSSKTAYLICIKLYTLKHVDDNFKIFFFLGFLRKRLNIVNRAGTLHNFARDSTTFSVFMATKALNHKCNHSIYLLVTACHKSRLKSHMNFIWAPFRFENPFGTQCLLTRRAYCQLIRTVCLHEFTFRACRIKHLLCSHADIRQFPLFQQYGVLRCHYQLLVWKGTSWIP